MNPAITKKSYQAKHLVPEQYLCVQLKVIKVYMSNLHSTMFNLDIYYRDCIECILCNVFFIQFDSKSHYCYKKECV